MSENRSVLSSFESLFKYYKSLGEKAIVQVDDEALAKRSNAESNSIATMVKHLWGNMLSRWTDFRTTDGEKEWRKRDEEFENDIGSRDELNLKWEEGWKCLFDALADLNDSHLDSLIYIRNQGHTVLEAIHRQLAHYAYHVGQIVYLSKELSTSWLSLSIPRGESKAFNADKFSQEKQKTHFTEDFIQNPENNKK